MTYTIAFLVWWATGVLVVIIFERERRPRPVTVGYVLSTAALSLVTPAIAIGAAGWATYQEVLRARRR